jgi:putative colanic acid biosynthesis UDP-glucose lipid carrier transferase
MGNLSALLVILLSFIAAYAIRFTTSSLENTYLLVLLTGLLLSSVILPATGAYRIEFRWDVMRRMRRLIAGWALVVMTLLTTATLLKITADYSRIWFGLWVTFGFVGLVLLTLFQSAWWRYSGRLDRNRRRIVLVGSGESAARVESRLRAERNTQLELVACFGTPWSENEVESVTDLEAFIESNSVADVWIATEIDDRVLLESALDALKNIVVDVHVVPDLYQYRLLNQNVTEWEGLPVISLSGTPMTGSEWRLKAAMDRIGSAVLLVVASPLLVFIAMTVRISSPGPALFRQVRHGIGGEEISVLKFRTMKIHTEPEGQYTQAQPEDARVTSVGSFLRKTSLDELPQLINVLKGEMSLVGPRPHPVEMNQQYLSRIPKYMFRHKAKPGITGWAQVNGLRGITETEEKMSLRIEHDLWYIQNWSLWLDLQILMRTPFAMVGRNVF